MKRYSFIFFLASFLGVTSFTACEEEATLDGATEVYITHRSMDINLKIGRYGEDFGDGYQCEWESDRDSCLLVDRRPDGCCLAG